MTEQCWGEFLDHEWFYDRPAPIPEPWRSHPNAHQSFLFPRSLVEELAQPERLREIRGTQKVDHVRHELLTGGLREPLEIVVDATGLLVLRDGHHRLRGSEGIPAYSELPAFFTFSGRIRTASRRSCDLIERLIRDGRPATSGAARRPKIGRLPITTAAERRN